MLNRFMKKLFLQNRSTSGNEIIIAANKLRFNDFNIYRRHELRGVVSKMAIVNLDTDTGSHWVCYYIDTYQGGVKSFYFDSYCTQCPKEIEKVLPKPIHLYIGQPFQKPTEANCASYCLYFLYLRNLAPYNCSGYTLQYI